MVIYYLCSLNSAPPAPNVVSAWRSGSHLHEAHATPYDPNEIDTLWFIFAHTGGSELLFWRAVTCIFHNACRAYGW